MSMWHIINSVVYMEIAYARALVGDAGGGNLLPTMLIISVETCILAALACTCVCSIVEIAATAVAGLVKRYSVQNQ